jgi:hypothetical protein
MMPDQDPQSGKEDAKPSDAKAVPADDPHKVEKLTKAGRDEIDPNQDSES